jgi:hypothetical protein
MPQCGIVTDISANGNSIYIQSDRKDTQPILKYLMLTIQYNSIGLINTQYLCGHQEPTQVTSCCNLLAPVSCLQTVEVQGCLFRKCNGCSLSNTTWHLVLTKLGRICFRVQFPILLCQTNQRYLVWWTVSVTQETCRNSSPGCIKHEEKSECMHRWTRWAFPTHDITLFFLISM